jgi:O-antigen/teichoic acid export membrane protein
MAVVLPKEDREAVNVLLLSLLITLTVGGIILFCVILFNKEISLLLGNASISFWLYFIPLSVLLTGLYQTFNYWCNRKKRFKNISASRVSDSFSKSSANLLIGYLKWTPGGLIIGRIIGQLFSTSALLIHNLKEIISLRHFYSRQIIKSQAKKHKDFPFFSLPTALLDVISIQIPIVIIVHLFSNYYVGLYSFAFRMLSIPISLIGVSVGQVFYQKFTELYNSNGDLKKLILKTWSSLFFIGIIPMIVMVLWGSEVFSFVFGEKWIDSGRMASFLSIILFFIFVSSPTSSAFIVLKLQKVSLIFGAVLVILRPLAFYIGFVYQDFYLALTVLVTIEIVHISIYNYIIWIKIGQKNTHRK